MFDYYWPACHESLFDLQLLTRALLEGSYFPAARVLETALSAEGFDDLAVIRLAIQQLKALFPALHRGPYLEVAQWLFTEHGLYLRDKSRDLSTIQRRFHLQLPVTS